MNSRAVKFYDNIRPYGWCSFYIELTRDLEEIRTPLTTGKTKKEAIETANETINSLEKDKSLGFVTTIPCSELAFHMLNRTKNLDKYELIRLHGEDVIVYLISQNRT